MKIFDWIQPNRSVYSSSFTFYGGRKTRLCTGGGGKVMIIDNEEEKKPLLSEISMMDEQLVFDNWKNMDGILTIGTLEIDPLDLNQKQEILEINNNNHHGNGDHHQNEIQHDINDDDNDHNQMLDPHFTTTTATTTVVQNPPHCCGIINMCKIYPQSSRDVTCNKSMEQLGTDDILDDINTTDDHHLDDIDRGIKSTVDDDEDQKMKKLEIRRVTLLDLFQADDKHSFGGKNNHNHNSTSTKEFKVDPNSHINSKTIKDTNPNSKAISHRGFGTRGLISSKAKKLLPRINYKQDLRPLTKLNQFMTRMTEKKVHPDFEEGKTTDQKKKGSQNNKYYSIKATDDVKAINSDAGRVYICAKALAAVGESVSLLPVQDIMV